MPRKPLERSNHLPYHVTARANNRESFPLPLPLVWRVLTSECLNLRITHEIEVHSLVLMPNHFHMLITTPKQDLGVTMDLFLSYVTKHCNLIAGRSGRIFGARYHWTIIKDSRYFANAYKYVYRNPVRAGLTDSVETWPFSTIGGLIGSAHLPFPLFQTRIGLELNFPAFEPLDQIPWLNRPFTTEVEVMIQSALRKRTFAPVYERRLRGPSDLLDRVH